MTTSNICVKIPHLRNHAKVFIKQEDAMPVSDIDVRIGKKIRHLRTVRNLTQEDLAKLVGVKFQQIGKYECGGNRLTPVRLVALSKALGVTVSYLFSEDESKAPEYGDALLERQVAKLTKAFLKYDERGRKALLAMIDELDPKGD